MKYHQILVRYGDLTLKGKNKHLFINRVVQLTKEKLQGLHCEIRKTHDRIYIQLQEDNQEEVIKHLGYVSGILSYSFIVEAQTTTDLAQVAETAIALLNHSVTTPATFKIASKRVDKNFPHTSIELSQVLAKMILKSCPQLTVDVHNPEVVLHVELRAQETYLYLNEIKGLGGFPVGVAGKGLVMMSGGIDSPVAGFLCMKQGVEIECIHFESTPLTSIESAQKVVDLVKKLAVYAPHNRIKLHMVPFKELHMELLDKIPESYNITIMRRMMYRIAAGVAEQNDMNVLINGESIGQVASQTLGSMKTINHVTSFPVIRPLATYDKNDIIKIARAIDTFDISIQPFEDCCTIYVPKSPTTNPSIEKAEKYESNFDYGKYVDFCVKSTKTVVIDKDSDLNMSFLGLEVRNVL